jgi:hypothetical protein
MGAEQSKVNGMYLPPQSGKTRKMNTEIIQEKITDDIYNDGVVVNFIISSNNLVLVEQTKQRVETELQSEVQSDVYTWRSGKKEEGKLVKTPSPKELFYDILEGGCDTVVMCANAIRLKQLFETIDLLQKSVYFNQKINVWIDEADASIRLWKKYEEIIGFSKLNRVTFVSATFDEIFKRYEKLYVLGYEHTHPECYRCLTHCIQEEVNLVTTPLDYVQHVVTSYALAKPGVRAFIPGDSTQVSHDLIAKYLVEQGFVVVIINGARKEIVVPGESPIDLRPYISSLDELNLTLAKLYQENHWDQRPFAITGRNCVERGVTFQCPISLPAIHPSKMHQGFLFTDGIIPPIADASTAYQIMARLFGNIGNDPTYTPSTIYTTKSMFKKVEKQESCAIHLAKIALERRTEWERGAELGAAEVKMAKNITRNASKQHALFATQEEAIVFIKTMFDCRVNKRSGDAPKELQVNGENPTVQYLIDRWWGLNKDFKYRMVPAVEGWLVYWNE